MSEQSSSFIDEAEIIKVLGAPAHKDTPAVRAVLEKARALKGLDMNDVACLSSVSDPELLGEIFQTARAVKDQIYGPRLVLFAPLYVSNKDYASPETRAAGEKLVGSTLANMDQRQREISERLVRTVKGGKRDVYV